MEDAEPLCATPVILTLPPEILNQLISTLTSDPATYHTLLSLRLTHRLFATLISLTALKFQHALLSRHYFQNEVTSVLSGTYDHRSTIPDLWPCYICLHLRHRTDFSHSQTHSHHSVAHAKAHLRICLACGVRKGIYVPGTVLRCFQGPDKVVCLSCRCFGVSAKVLGTVAGKVPPSSISAETISGREDSLASMSVPEDDVPRNALRSDREVKGLCWNCAYGGGSPSSKIEGDKVRNIKQLPGEYFIEQLMGCQASGQLHFGKGTSERKGRCQRCWAVDHTGRAAQRMHGNQVLCQECWLRRWI